MASVEKIVIDTDTGIDDALALFLALGSGTLAQVIAITCSFGNTKLENACNNVMRVLTLLNRTEVPVYKGSAGALVFDNLKESDLVMGDDGLGNEASKFPIGNFNMQDTPAAVELVRLTLKYPGEINLVVIGPLTNAALAQRIDRNFTQRLKSLTIMGGNYKGVGNVNSVAEFNFYADTEAAEIVLSEVECPVTLVPWETVYESCQDWELYKKLTQIQSPKGRFFKLTSKFMAEPRNYYCDCDLLALISLLYPQSVTSTIWNSLAVETGGKYSKGLTILLWDSNPAAYNRTKVKIVTGFNRDCLNSLRFHTLQQN